MSAIVHEHQTPPRRLSILWMLPLQAASLFTVWAITSGGETLRGWMLTALLWLMTMPLLVGLEGTLTAMLLFEPFRGFLRRAQYLIVNYSGEDPIHLLTPIVTLMALAMVLRKQRLSMFWATPLASWVSLLALIFFLEIFNPLQGSLFVGLTGALFMLVPIGWFYFGQSVSDKFVEKAFGLIVVLGIIGSLYGVYQLVFGYPAFEQYWIDNTDFYTSIAVGHAQRALGTFSSAEEWGRYTQVGAIIALGTAFASRQLVKRVAWFVCTAALLIAIIVSGQRTAVFGFLIGAITLMLLGARNWRGAVGRVTLLLLPLVLVMVFVKPPSDDEMWSKDESDKVGTLLTHTQRGTMNPAEEESLQIRVQNWSYLITSVIPYRPLGSGLGTSQLADIRSNRDSEMPPIDNFILVVALACGIPAALLFVWILLRATWGSMRMARAPSSSTKTNTMRIAAAIMPALILNSVFGLTFSIYSVAPIAWFLIGWVSAEMQRARNSEEEREVITI